MSQKLYDKSVVNQTVLLEGELKFSSLTKKINNNSQYYPNDVYKVVISNPRLADVNKWGLQGNGADTELAKRLFDPEYSHSVYTTKAGDKEWSFETTSFPPRILDLKTKDTAMVDEILDGELGNGQTVVLAFRVYQSKNNPNFIGGSLDYVGIEDANNIEYFQNSSFTSMFGKPSGKINKKKPVEQPTENETETPVAPVQPEQNQQIDATDNLDDLFD